MVTFKRAKCEDPQYGLVDNGGDHVYESEMALANGASNLYAFCHLNLHGGGFGSQDLRLAWGGLGDDRSVTSPSSDAHLSNIYWTHDAVCM